MSTPISQGSKLTGLELYAPRRADMQSEPASVTSPQMSAPESASEAMLDESNDGDLSDDGSIEAVYAQLDEAIKNTIDIGRLSDSDELRADEPQLPPAPQLRSDDRIVTVNFALPAAKVPRRNDADAEVEVVAPFAAESGHRAGAHRYTPARLADLAPSLCFDDWRRRSPGLSDCSHAIHSRAAEHPPTGRWKQ